MDHEQNASTSTVRNAGSSQVQTPSHRRQAHSRANSLSLSTHFLPQPLPLRVESTGEPVRVRERGHRVPVGPRARRRERGGAEHAGGDRQQGAHPGVHPSGEGPQGQLPPHGLWPPGVQGVRPPRQDHAQHHPPGERASEVTIMSRKREPLEARAVCEDRGADEACGRRMEGLSFCHHPPHGPTQEQEVRTTGTQGRAPACALVAAEYYKRASQL
eukprot:1196084-Prorocentrum_minimum.AAC.6